jgi:hypothetical protein
MMTGTERANLMAAARQTATNLSRAVTRADRHGAPEAEIQALRDDWLALGAAIDRDDAAVIRPLLEKHDPYYRRERT